MSEQENPDIFTTAGAPMDDDSQSVEEYQLPTEEWLVSGFERNLEALKAGVPLPAIKTLAKLSPEPQLQENGDKASLYEQAIIEIDELRDYLISAFNENKDNKKLFKVFEDSIHMVEKTIRSLGGETEEFNPLVCMSGLEGAPENPKSKEEVLLVNAQSVIENTLKHYTMHKMASIQPKVIKNKPAIVLQINGKDENEDFKVVGAVVAKGNFNGDEAVDYVRCEGKGQLSVKSFRNGRWDDISDGFHLHIEDR